MTGRYLKDEAIALSVNDSLELFDDRGMEFVEFVLWEHLADKFPQDDLFTWAFLGFLQVSLSLPTYKCFFLNKSPQMLKGVIQFYFSNI